MASSLHIVMPAHNEGAVIAKVIGRIRENFANARVIVVNDGSSDQTADEALHSGAYTITLPFNCGYGVALQTGVLHPSRCGAPVVVPMDADAQHEPETIRRLMEPVASGAADVSLGSR